MTWITGTATDYKDLLDKLRGHLVDEGWTINDYDTGGAAPNTDSLYFQGPGYGVGYEVFGQIRTYEDAPNNNYCWEAHGVTNYDAGQTFEHQPGYATAGVYTRLWNATIPYWLSVSDRRVALVAKCSNTYHSLYIGFFNPFANPVEYPYPYYFASDAATVGPFGNTDGDVRSMAFPGDGGGYLREPGGLWRPVCVHQDSAAFKFQGGSTSRYSVWPYLTYVATGGDNPTNAYAYPPYARIEPMPGLSDSLFAMNCYLWGLYDEVGVAGVLEGLYWIPGNALSAEQVVTLDGDDYHVFIAISRSIEAPNQFYALKEA